MSLEEQFESDGNFCDNQIYTYGCIKIADKLAIDFANWMAKEYWLNSSGKYMQGQTNEELLLIFKKENGL